MRAYFKALFWLIVVAGAAVGVGMLFFKVRTAPDDSMAPSLLAGDKFLLCYRCNIDKGDAVLCDHPDPDRKGVQIMGRVVGMEGDKVEIRQGVLRVNDSPKNLTTDAIPYRYYLGPDRQVESQEYMLWQHASLFGSQVPVLYNKSANGLLPDHAPVIVGHGSYFLIGDHRQLSRGWTDDGIVAPGGGCNSSFCYGEIPVSNCHGVIYFVYKAVDRGLSAPPSQRRYKFMP